jgi:hypothetical protein
MGRCIAPKPQGPFTLKGGSGGVSFKNVFGSETEFTITVGRCTLNSFDP